MARYRFDQEVDYKGKRVTIIKVTDNKSKGKVSYTLSNGNVVSELELIQPKKIVKKQVKKTHKKESVSPVEKVDSVIDNEAVKK